MDYLQNQTKDISNPFVSPYSYRQGYELVWFKVDTRWKGIQPAHSIPDRVRDIVVLTNGLRVVSKFQLIRHFWSKNSQDANKTLAKLMRYGILTKHVLKNKGKEMGLYTLGPMGAKIINTPYTPNWWFEMDKTAVLKQLASNQLFFKMCQAGEVKCLPAPYPFTTVIDYKGHELPIIVARGDVDTLVDELGRVEFLKGMVICEDIEQIEKIGPHLTKPVRYTTDYDLIYTNLNTSFYKWVPGKGVIREKINLFPDGI